MSLKGSLLPLLKFISKETLTIEGETVQYGNVEYANPLYDMLGCLFWKDRYFVLEHCIILPDSIFIGEFQGSTHKNLGPCPELSTFSNEETKKSCLIKFFKELLKNEEKNKN